MALVALRLTAPAWAQPSGRLTKTDARVKMLRNAARLGLKPARLGRLAPRLLRRGDQEVNVTITFNSELTNEQVEDYEGRGISFMRLPDGGLARHRHFYAAWVSEPALAALDADPNVDYIEPGSAFEWVPTLEVSSAEIQADIRHRTPVGFDFRGNQGAGVVIADFEAAGALDVFHPDFFKVEHFSPYDWIDADANGLFVPGFDYVDLNRNGQADDGERLGFHESHIINGKFDPDRDWLFADANNNGVRDYGPAAGYDESDPTYGERVFLAVDANGNHAFDVGEKLLALGESKIRAVRGADGAMYSRGVDLIDAPPDLNGHGTSVCGILVGQDAGLGRRYVGVAPDAELLVVHYSATSPNDLEAALWAKANGADVMLWEFGSWTGQFLDGSTALEQFITDEMSSGSTLQVTPTGNLASSERHARLNVGAQGTVTQPFEIPSGIQPGSIAISVLWQGQEGDVSLALRRAGSSSFTEIAEITDPSEFSLFEVDHFATRGGSLSTRGTARFDIQLYRDGATFDPAEWELQVVNNAFTSRTVHLMIQDNATTWSGGVYWTSNTTDDNTLCYPATADLSLNVGSYSVDQDPGRLSYFSSRGPRIDGVSQEGVTAPGHHDILCAQSGDVTGSWAPVRTDFGGTSAAGPHVAGAAALLMSAVPDAGIMEVYDALLQGALSDGDTGPVFNDAWGYGKLRADDAYRLLTAEVCPGLVTPVLVSPADGAVDLDPEDVTLAWQDQPEAQLYDLYFGTTDPPPFMAPNIAVSSLFAGTLEPNTTYYWQLYAKSTCGSTEASSVRYFTTGGLPAPEINLLAGGVPVGSGATVVVPETDAGGSTELTLYIENNGAEFLTLSGGPDLVSVIDGEDTFTVIEQPPAAVEPFGLESFVVEFAPQAGGTYEATLEILSDDEDEPVYQITLVGEAPRYPQIEITHSTTDENGQPVEFDVPHESVFAFPDTPVGEETELIFTIHSVGDDDLLITGEVQIAGANPDDFAVTLQPSTTPITPPGSDSFRVAFSPAAAGMRQASFTIASNDPDFGLHTVALTGFGTEGDVEIHPPPPPGDEPDPEPEPEPAPDPGPEPPPATEEPEPVDPEPAPVEDPAKKVSGDAPENGPIEDDEATAGGQPGGGMCGAGGLGTVPVLLLGLGGLKLTRGPRWKLAAGCQETRR